MIEVWSTLRTDGQRANAYDAEVLHFYLVLCVALILAFPEPKGWRRFKLLGATLAGLLLFHALALLITVEHTYAVLLAEVARRNYGPAEAAAYGWLHESFAFFAVQLVPAAVLLVLFVRYGGLRAVQPSVPREEPGAPAGPSGRRGRRAARVAAAAAAVVLAGVTVAAGAAQMKKVRARQAESACARGYRVLDEGDLEGAARDFEKATDLNPEFLEAHDGLGRALLRLGRAPEAERAFREALRIREDYLSALIGFANALLEQDRAEEAAAGFRRAAGLHPDRWEPRFNLARALLQAGRTSEAEAPLREAITLEPGQAMPRLLLARVLIAGGRLCEALPGLQLFMSLEPDSPYTDLVRRTLEEGRSRCGLVVP